VAAKEGVVDKTKALDALAVQGSDADPPNQEAHGHGEDRTVWVGNINGREADEVILKEVFETCCVLDVTASTLHHDEIVEDIVIREKGAGKKDWALVTFYKAEHAKIAADKHLRTELKLELPDLSKDWEIKMFVPKKIHSNAAHLVQKINESVTYRHDIDHGDVKQRHARQPKVMMGPRYERAMGSRREHVDPTAAEDAAKLQMAAAERMGLDPNSMAGHLVRTIAAFGTMEDEKNKELKATLVDHKGLQKSLYTAAVKMHWKAPPRKGRGAPSPPSDGLDGPSSLASTSNRPSSAPAKSSSSTATQFGRVL